MSRARLEAVGEPHWEAEMDMVWMCSKSCQQVGKFGLVGMKRFATRSSIKRLREGLGIVEEERIKKHLVVGIT